MDFGIEHRIMHFFLINVIKKKISPHSVAIPTLLDNDVMKG
jgi:hypothetical protein